MTLPISYFRFYFPEYVLKTRLPLNCATGFLDSLKPRRSIRRGLIHDHSDHNNNMAASFKTRCFL